MNSTLMLVLVGVLVCFSITCNAQDAGVGSCRSSFVSRRGSSNVCADDNTCARFRSAGRDGPSDQVLNTAIQQAQASARTNSTMRSLLQLHQTQQLANHPDCRPDCFPIGWPNSCNKYVWFYHNGQWVIIINLPGFPVHVYCSCPPSTCSSRFWLTSGRCAAYVRRRWTLVVYPNGNWAFIHIHTQWGCGCKCTNTSSTRRPPVRRG